MRPAARSMPPAMAAGSSDSSLQLDHLGVADRRADRSATVPQVPSNPAGPKRAAALVAPRNPGIRSRDRSRLARQRRANPPQNLLPLFKVARQNIFASPMAFFPSFAWLFSPCSWLSLLGCICSSVRARLPPVAEALLGHGAQIAKPRPSACHPRQVLQLSLMFEQPLPHPRQPLRRLMKQACG